MRDPRAANLARILVGYSTKVAEGETVTIDGESAAEPLLAAVYGADLTLASGALPWLALAMTLLACAYLAVQYLLALGRASFLWVLGVAAVVEPLLLQGIGAKLTEIAVGLLALELALAAVVLAMGFRAARPAGREAVPLSA